MNIRKNNPFIAALAYLWDGKEYSELNPHLPAKGFVDLAVAMQHAVQMKDCDAIETDRATSFCNSLLKPRGSLLGWLMDNDEAAKKWLFDHTKDPDNVRVENVQEYRRRFGLYMAELWENAK